jgi:hypothetical protein
MAPTAFSFMKVGNAAPPNLLLTIFNLQKNCMKQLSLLFVAGLMLVITGCPLRTDLPIDAGSYTSTGWLLGKWTEQKNDGTAGDIYLVKKGNRPGIVQIYEVTKGESSARPRPSVLSSIGNKIFINVYDEDEDNDKGYYIYQLRKISDKEIELLPVREYSIEASASAKKLQAFLREHLNDEAIYEPKEIARLKKDVR